MHHEVREHAASGSRCIRHHDSGHGGGAQQWTRHDNTRLSSAWEPAKLQRGHLPHGVSYLQQVRGGWSRAGHGGMPSSDGNRRQGPCSQHDDKAPWNLCEIKMEDIGVDLEPAKWCWFSEAESRAAHRARATTMVVSGAKSVKLSNYLGRSCKHLAQGRY